jgi:transposase
MLESRAVKLTLQTQLLPNQNRARTFSATVTDTGRGIAAEGLGVVRNRTRSGKKRRDRLSRRAFAELRLYTEYKAALAGVRARPVGPGNTSRRCHECNYVSAKNRMWRDVFRRVDRGHFDHADVVGAKTIRSGALTYQARRLRGGGKPRKSSGLAPSTIAGWSRRLFELKM